MKDIFTKHSELDITPVVEQRPFEKPAFPSFFAEWCNNNDSLVPTVVSRDEWSEHDILQPGPDGTKTLALPQDLQLWEMPRVVGAIDHDTFPEDPERQTEAEDRLKALGETFMNAGTYIAQRLDSVTDGQEIARSLALTFHGYGQALSSGIMPEETPQIEEVATRDLTPDETAEIDCFLAGEDLYASRQRKVAKVIDAGFNPDEAHEVVRQHTLAQSFRVVNQALELQARDERGELQASTDDSPPWQDDTPIHSAILKSMQKRLTQQIETPKQELVASIFRRGMERLHREMPSPSGQEPLRETLRIDYLRNELEAVRQTGNLDRISAAERKIADSIQIVISSFPYQKAVWKPSEITTNIQLNCVGASMLGGALMHEAGLHYLVGSVPGHSILFLVTSDGHVEWRDMRYAEANEDLQDNMIKGQKKDGTALTVADIVQFSKNPSPEGLLFDIDSPGYRHFVPGAKEGQRQFVIVFEPEYGQQLQVLNKTGIDLHVRGYTEEAIKAYRQAIARDPNDAHPYNNLGTTLRSLNRQEEAIEAYRQAIARDLDYANPFYGLGHALLFLRKNEEAVQALRQSVALDPKTIYHLYDFGHTLRLQGRHEQAIAEYQMVIALNPEFSRAYCSLGDALGSLERYEEAAKAYQQAIECNPKYVSYYHQLGYTLAKLGHIEEAHEIFQQAIALNLEDNFIYIGLGYTHALLDRKDEAVQAYKRAISLNPKDVRSHLFLGDTLNSLGRHEEEVEVYQQAIKLDLKDVKIYIALGKTLRLLKRNEEAIEVYQQANTLYPENARPLYGLGNALQSLDRHEEAIVEYKKASTLDPKDAYPYWGLSMSLDSLGRYEEAVEALRQFIERADKEKDEKWIKRAEKIIEEFGK